MFDHFESRAAQTRRRELAVPLWLFLLHLIAAPLVPLYWRWITKVPSCTCGLHVTVEFWFGFASLCLFLYASAGWRVLRALRRDIAEETPVLQTPGLARGAMAASLVLYSPLALAVCASLLAVFSKEEAPDIVGQGDFSRLALWTLASVCCLLALVLPGLAAHLAVNATLKSTTRSHAVVHFLTLSCGALYVWLLLVPPLRLAGPFPLPQILAAAAIAAGLPGKARRWEAGPWIGTSLSVGTALVILVVGALTHAGNDVLVLGLLSLCLLIVVLSLVPSWAYQRSHFFEKWLPFVSLAALEGYIAFVRWPWIASAFSGTQWERDWAISLLHGQLAGGGACWGAFMAVVRVLARRRHGQRPDRYLLAEVKSIETQLPMMRSIETQLPMMRSSRGTSR